MKYLITRFAIQCDNEELKQVCRELLADDCGECGYESFEDTEQGVDAYIQEDSYSELLLKPVIEGFPIDDVTITYETEDIPDQDWNEVWEQQGFEPINVKGMVTIYDARNTTDTEQFSTPIQIGIHTTNAFGTGTHETTRMIVSTLLEMPMEGRRILDCGCGTGILAITALKCGASQAVGYDIDEWSADNAKHNATINGVDQQMDVLLGNVGVLSHVEGLFDVVLANINRNILLADMEHFRSVMSQGATLILSGFYEDDIPLLIECATNLGLQEVERKADGDWRCLILKN